MPDYVPLAISYAKGGLVESEAAFNLTDDSFQTLENAYNFRGRIRRRQGFTQLGRLRRTFTMQMLGSTDAGGAFSGNLKTLFSLEANSEIATGSITITIGAQTFVEADPPDGTLNDGGAGTGTINYMTGDITIQTSPIIALAAITITFSYYPNLPVMGTRTLETQVINQELLVCFDTRYAYIYSILSNLFTQLGTATWNGTNSQFFYTSNVLLPNAIPSAAILLFATNFNFTLVGTPDPIRYFDGTNWIDFSPFIDSANTIHLLQARIIIQYRGRLVALHTVEGVNFAGQIEYPQRARWSQFGSPLPVNAWYSDIAGRGGFIDCPTSEQIVSADFVRDTLIVGFERSTWKLRYTGNEITPFVWERINKELGVESTFSTVAFDKGILAIGDKSINICDGNGVEPIDQNIPDEVFRIHNGNDGPFRVQGIRDFYLRQVYWTFPNAAQNGVFPNRLFVFDYERQSWAIFTDSFTTLGNWQRTTDIRWIDLTIAWSEANFSWEAAPMQSQFPNTVAGNQQGFVLLLNQCVRNYPSLTVNDISSATTSVIITSYNHNLENGQTIRFSGIIGNGDFLNDNTYFVFFDDTTDLDTFKIQEYDALTGQLNVVSGTVGTYLGGGEIETVFNMKVRSKKFSLIKEGKRGEFGYIDFLADTTQNGEVSCEIRTDYNESTVINPEVIGSTNNFYNTNFTTQRNNQFNQQGDVLWQRFFCPTQAQFFDFTLTFSPRQMATPAIVDADVRIEAFILWLSKGARLVK